jgi:hypothetical protein
MKYNDFKFERKICIGFVLIIFGLIILLIS